MTLLERVKTLCNDNSITLAKLEKTLTFGNGTLSRWDDSSPSGDKLLKVADYFGVTTDYLLGKEDLKLSNPSIAAHRDDSEEWTKEELSKIDEYKQLLLAARQMKK